VVPKKIINVISKVQKHKKIPGFIYNVPEDLRKEIIGSQKHAIVIDAQNINSKNYIVNQICKQMSLPQMVGDSSLAMVRIEQSIGNFIIIINGAEYLASGAYAQVKEFAKSKIPVLLLSSYKGFGNRFRGTKFYRDNNFFDCDYKEVV
jgi:hypothetical protein